MPGKPETQGTLAGGAWVQRSRESPELVKAGSDSSVSSDKNMCDVVCKPAVTKPRSGNKFDGRRAL